MAETTELMTVDNICNRVYIIRGQQVMLGYDFFCGTILIATIRRVNSSEIWIPVKSRYDIEPYFQVDINLNSTIEINVATKMAILSFPMLRFA